MPKPLVVLIPHSLGKDEALRRLRSSVDRLKSQFSGQIASLNEVWAADRMTFRVGAMGQMIDGHLDVLEDSVRVEVQLPWILNALADKARSFIQRQGQLLLEKKL